MKKIFVFICIFICAITVITAQTNQSPQSQKLYYAWNIPFSGYADSTWVYANSGRVDTLYAKHWRWGTAEFIRVGGAKRSSLTIDVTDSMSIDVVVKSRTRSAGFGAASAWATIIDDSLDNSTTPSSSGLVKEFSIVDSDSDLFDNIDTELMIILTCLAHQPRDTQGTAKLRARLNWVQ